MKRLIAQKSVLALKVGNAALGVEDLDGRGWEFSQKPTVDLTLAELGEFVTLPVEFGDLLVDGLRDPAFAGLQIEISELAAQFGGNPLQTVLLLALSRRSLRQELVDGLL